MGEHSASCVGNVLQLLTEVLVAALGFLRRHQVDSEASWGPIELVVAPFVRLGTQLKGNTTGASAAGAAAV